MSIRIRANRARELASRSEGSERVVSRRAPVVGHRHLQLRIFAGIGPGTAASGGIGDLGRLAICVRGDWRLGVSVGTDMVSYVPHRPPGESGNDS